MHNSFSELAQRSTPHPLISTLPDNANKLGLNAFVASSSPAHYYPINSATLTPSQLRTPIGSPIKIPSGGLSHNNGIGILSNGSPLRMAQLSSPVGSPLKAPPVPSTATTATTSSSSSPIPINGYTSSPRPIRRSLGNGTPVGSVVPLTSSTPSSPALNRRVSPSAIPARLTSSGNKSNYVNGTGGGDWNPFNGSMTGTNTSLNSGGGGGIGNGTGGGGVNGTIIQQQQQLGNGGNNSRQIVDLLA